MTGWAGGWARPSPTAATWIPPSGTTTPASARSRPATAPARPPASTFGARSTSMKSSRGHQRRTGRGRRLPGRSRDQRRGQRRVNADAAYYYLQDANYNVTTVTDANCDVVERSGTRPTAGPPSPTSTAVAAPAPPSAGRHAPHPGRSLAGPVLRPGDRPFLQPRPHPRPSPRPFLQTRPAGVRRWDEFV